MMLLWGVARGTSQGKEGREKIEDFKFGVLYCGAKRA
jgi:hypothetical protein